jgi:hypothetical protein
MTCEIRHFGIQEPKGWDGTHAHPALQESDVNLIDTPYYESEDEDEESDDEMTSEYNDTDSDCQSVDETKASKRVVRPKRLVKVYQNILTDESDYIPE